MVFLACAIQLKMGTPFGFALEEGQPT